jgi:putative Holliday junction resolvase
MALDLGKARVGVAITDELGMFAHARPALDGHNRKPLLASIARIAREQEVGRILVGFPLELSGREGPAARRALAFAHEVADATGLEVELVDERLSTVEAAAQLRASGVGTRESKSKIDGVAAVVLLEAWLSGHGRQGEGSPG